jgi:hypothetical protein
LPTPIPSKAVNVAMPGPSVDFNGQPTVHHSNVDQVFIPGHCYPVVGYPTLDLGLPEQPVQYPFGLCTCPVCGLPQHLAQPRRSVAAKRSAVRGMKLSERHPTL